MKARVIAYYLPQFHPIPENDEAWGQGFTEWTNVAKAKPQFKGHNQPRVPADLGFYDLRLSEVREKQAELARECGIEGFCYWHYWMGNGKRLLQRPFQEVLSSGNPDFPFCLAWANHTWKTGTWDTGGGNRIIVPQLYPGKQDYIQHFNTLLSAFRDHRYMRIDGMPIFVIFDPYGFKEVSLFIELWNKLAKDNGLEGIYFIALIHSTTTMRRLPDGRVKRVHPNLKTSSQVYRDILSLGFNGINSFGKPRAEMYYQGKYTRIMKYLLHKKLPFLPTLRLDYKKVMEYFFAPEDVWENVYPTIFPQWDRTPRAGNSEGVYVNATPKNFEIHIKQALKVIEKKDFDHRVLFLRSWNEWGEGNYVEPDLLYGHGFLEAIKNAVLR